VPPRPDRPATAAVGRRAVVTGLAGATVLALAGCDSGTPGNDLPGTAEAQQDADLQLVREALAVSLAAGAQLGLVATGALRPRLAPLIAMHQAHAQALADAVPSGSPSPSVAGTVVPPAPGLARARQVEADAHDRLVALAQRAQSGQLARLLASMAAGISQRLAVLR
jgi:hypothetical protein